MPYGCRYDFSLVEIADKSEPLQNFPSFLLFLYEFSQSLRGQMRLHFEQPVTSPDHLELDQTTKVPEIIVANRTHWLTNSRYKSSEDKVPVSESSGCTGVGASNLDAALSQISSTAMGTTRIRFKCDIECHEPLKCRRSQHIQTSRVYASGW